MFNTPPNLATSSVHTHGFSPWLPPLTSTATSPIQAPPRRQTRLALVGGVLAVLRSHLPSDLRWTASRGLPGRDPFVSPASWHQGPACRRKPDARVTSLGAFWVSVSLPIRPEPPGGQARVALAPVRSHASQWAGCHSDLRDVNKRNPHRQAPCLLPGPRAAFQTA